MLPGNAILLNGAVQTANRENGVPGPQSPEFGPRIRQYLWATLAGLLCTDAFCKYRRGAVPLIY